MTVSELAELLKSFPQDVPFGVGYPGANGQTAVFWDIDEQGVMILTDEKKGTVVMIAT